MAKKTNKIKQIQQKDIKAMAIISNCGHASHQQLSIHLKDNRIDAWRSRGVIEERSYRDVNGEYQTAYALTVKGKDFTKKHMGLDNHQSTNKKKTKHDVAVAKRYTSLSEQERSTYKNETVLRAEFKEHLMELKHSNPTLHQEINNLYRSKQISTPDGAYTSTSANGESVTVYAETITRNYKEQEIIAKHNYVAVMGGELQMDRT